MKRIVLALALSCACLAAPSAFAQMGGMAPTASAPRQDPNVPYQAGMAAYNAHNYSEAVRQLQTARRLSPRDGLISYALGLALNANGDKEEAKGAFERSVRARNAPVQAHLQLGLVALELADRETATEQQAALQRLIAECDATCGDARRGQMQTALDQLNQALATP